MDAINKATVVIGTFGSNEWALRGASLCNSVQLQHECPVIHVHGNTLAHARNKGAFLADTEWLVFLDADDCLEEDYIETLLNGRGDLRAPRLFFIEDNVDPWEPFDLTERDINHGNPCVIGTMIRREMFLDVGCFQEHRAWEDWAMFQRCAMIGAEIVHHDAIYIATSNPNSRNNTIKRPRKLAAEIQEANKNWKETYDRYQSNFTDNV